MTKAIATVALCCILSSSAVGNIEIAPEPIISIETEVIAETQESVTELTEVVEIAEVTEPEWKCIGNFRITHYCSCSKCCGKWAKYNKTASGTTPEAGRTIAVNRDQIPLGSEVMIGGQVYIAEDTGNGIKDNCIDIYVSSHDDAKQKGLYYTDVYMR